MPTRAINLSKNPGGVLTYANTSVLPATATTGQLAFVLSNNRMYIWNSGWYSIAAVNQTPTFTSVPGAAVSVNTTYTTTLQASDPEGLPITYGFSVGGGTGFSASDVSLNSSSGDLTANFASATSDVSITFTASDGINIASSTSTFLVCDRYFEYTSLLLKAVGSNNQNNNAIVDSSSNNMTITRNGDVIQGSFTPFSLEDGYWSNYFDGTGDYLSFAPNTAFAFGTGDFTVEAWIMRTGGSGNQPIMQSDVLGSSTNDKWWFAVAGTGLYFGTHSSGGFNVQTTTTFNLNQWYHVAVTRSSGTMRMFVDGVNTAFATSGTPSGYNLSQAGFAIGAMSTPSYWTGYISNARVVKGIALYTSSFTVPATSLTAVSGTSLLTCQSNRLKDNSTNNLTVIKNGDTKVVAFGPNNPTTTYSPEVVGGSLYFDGSGDTLSLSHNAALTFGAGDFTVEQWIYPQRTSGASLMISGIWDSIYPAPQSWIQFLNTSGNYTFTVDNASGGVDTVIFTSSISIPNDAWTHLAVTRSGSTWRMFINGVLDQTATNSLTINTGSNPYIVGLYTNVSAGDNIYKGYMSNHRIVKGTAVYTGNFTPPTTPLTAIANTSLLLSGTNAGIVDASRKSVLYTLGDTKVNTSVYKYTKSTYFDGTGDYMYIPSTLVDEMFQFGTGDFTVECWVRFSALASNRALIDAWVTGQANSWQLYYSATSSKIRWYVGSTTVVESTTTPSLDTWYHVAVARSGTTIRMFINGALEATTTAHSTNYNYKAPLGIGVQYSTLTNTFQGYLEDVRITKNVARYTAAFTPPTSAMLTR